MTCPDCEELRSRAEWAESRIASVSGVTREELAKREFERGRQGLPSTETKALLLDLQDALEARYDGAPDSSTRWMGFFSIASKKH